MLRKRILALCVAVVLVLTAFPVNVYAQQNEFIEIQPLWQNVSSVTVGLSFSGDTAFADARVVGFAGTTRISATITLARRNANGTYSNVRTWTASTNSGTLNFSNSTGNAPSGHTYRLTVTANVTRNGVTETVSNFITRQN